MALGTSAVASGGNRQKVSASRVTPAATDKARPQTVELAPTVIGGAAQHRSVERGGSTERRGTSSHPEDTVWLGAIDQVHRGADSGVQRSVTLHDEECVRVVLGVEGDWGSHGVRRNPVVHPGGDDLSGQVITGECPRIW